MTGETDRSISGHRPRVHPYGDSALLVEAADVAAAHALTRAVREGERSPPLSPRVVEVVVGFANLVLVFDGALTAADHTAWELWFGRAMTGLFRDGSGGPPPRTHLLPVVFDGADLRAVAERIGATVEDVADLLLAHELDVAFVGFAPGFPYLTGLPPALAGLPRRESPRTSVPAGSVAVAGGFASVYPVSTPGGWQLLGRTTEQLFDPVAAPHSRVAPGDRVRFTRADPGSPGRPDSDAAVDTTRPPLDATGPSLVVIEPGILSTVQDAGRTGAAGMGVPRGGAADARALELVNRLLGNPPTAATIECTASGPSVRMVGAGHVALVGTGAGAVDVRVDGHPVADCAVVPVEDGQTLSVGTVHRGLRAYLGVAGGVATPVVLGSRSSDLLAGLGPGPLRSGDRLARGAPGRVRGRLAMPDQPDANRPVVLRVLAGPHLRGGPPDRSPLDRLISSAWCVAPESNRIGVRLDAVDGGAIPHTASAAVASTPMLTGAIQLPPDGRPIILLPDHATVGGYPVIACVISADIPPLGQLPPGTVLSFVTVDRATARTELIRVRADTAARVTGWYPTTAGT